MSRLANRIGTEAVARWPLKLGRHGKSSFPALARFPFLQKGKHLFGMALRRNFWKNVQQSLIRADDERGSLDAPHFLPV